MPSIETVQLVAAARTDVGRVRKNNEDAFLCEPALGLFAVADGMGGHAAGEVASALALDVLHRAVTQSQNEPFLASPNLANRRLVLKFLRDTVRQINDAVHEHSLSDRQFRGMGCTLDVALFRGSGLFLAHVGDSRIYGLLGGLLYPLTEDHTLGQLLVSRGVLTQQEADAHPQRNRLSRAVGISPEVEVDTAYFDIAPGDVFLLCTDGVHGLVPPTSLTETLKKQTDFAARDLIDEALTNGGKDNTTAIVVRIGGSGVDPVVRMGSEEVRLAMSQADLFAGFTPAELLRVQQFAIGQLVAAGQTVFQADDLIDDVYLVLDGMLSVFDGPERAGWLGPGDPFGPLHFEPAPSSTSVRADVVSRLLVFPVAQVRELFSAEPTLGIKLQHNSLSRLWRRLGQLTEKFRRHMREKHATP